MAALVVGGEHLVAPDPVDGDARAIRQAGTADPAFLDLIGSSHQRFARLVQEAEAKGIKIVANERYSRTDTAVTGQVLKIIGARPDAVLVAGSGTPAALPQKTLAERGYKGAMYQTHGVANADFLRVGGKALEGSYITAAPVLVGDQLPSAHRPHMSPL